MYEVVLTVVTFEDKEKAADFLDLLTDDVMEADYIQGTDLAVLGQVKEVQVNETTEKD